MAANKGPQTLVAPVHGAVIGIEVVAGDAVAAGQTLLVQEAMKMEVPLAAPAAGVIRRTAAAVGDVVPEGAPLIEFEPNLHMDRWLSLWKRARASDEAPQSFETQCIRADGSMMPERSNPPA